MSVREFSSLSFSVPDHLFSRLTRSCTILIAKRVKDVHLVERRVRMRTLVSPARDWLHCCRRRRRCSYSRFLVRHHWFTVSAVVFVAVALTILGFVFTRLPDFSDPRKVSDESRAKGENSCMDVYRDGERAARVRSSPS